MVAKSSYLQFGGCGIVKYCCLYRGLPMPDLHKPGYALEEEGGEKGKVGMEREHVVSS